MKNELEYKLYVQRENGFTHEPAHYEQFIHNAVVNGDTEAILENRKKYPPSADDGKGKLSDNGFRNALYHMIINTAVITRICISEGLPQETAYTLSDIYIRRADRAKSIAEVSVLNDEMTLEFAALMKKNKAKIYSRPVRRTAEYICDNLHAKLTVGKIAEQTGYDRSYLSTLFRKETGETISGFIRRKRLETAKELLAVTDKPCSEIADTLGFSSQSHFTELFRARYGITPQKYKNGMGGATGTIVSPSQL